MSDGDPRTGMFHQRQVTVGDTTGNVNGVLQILEKYYTCTEINFNSHLFITLIIESLQRIHFQ